jgi:calcium-dependent protein kinase
VGTAGYIAPELFLQSTHHYDCQNDMFSLGCVFFEMLVGRKLFFEGISLTVMELNAEGYICINTDEICDAKAEDLLRRMLRSQPANRITVEMALMHPFIMDESQGSMFDEDEPVSI